MLNSDGAWVTGALNFAADRNDGGRVSTSTGEQAQSLRPGDVEVRNIRALARKPNLNDEGLAIVEHRVASPRWDDKEWVSTIYIPGCLELVKRLSGARWTLNMYDPIKRSRQAEGRTSAAANFIHWDQPRDQYRSAAQKVAAEHGKAFERAAVFNVWKAMTPPPQDLPLAIADRRSAPDADQVMGTSFGSYGEARHVKLAYSPASADWYYVPDLSLDESIVFLAADFDAARPLGCPHTAFCPPGHDGLPPRTSIEVRVLACFD